MAGADRFSDDDWRLDDKSFDRAEHEPRLVPLTTETVVNLSHERLTRPVYVVTAEHLAWYLVAVYALVTRAIALGARPLDPADARDALAALAIATHGGAALASGVGLHASWVAIVQGWIFAAVGATDLSSRIVVMLCGLLMVASGFAMRPFLGRAGALAFAALIAASPSVTYFSRGGSTAIASIAFMTVAIAIAESMRRRPGVVRAAGLGVAIALWLSADPIGYVTAAAMIVSLIFVGAGDAVRLDHRRLRLRVWWQRRRTLVIVCAVVAAGLWVLLTTAFFTRSLAAVAGYGLRAAFAWPPIALGHGLRTSLAILLAYEFIILILAIVAAVAIASRRLRDRVALWSVLWAIVSLVALATVAANRSCAAIAFVLPLAILGAYAVDWMHQSARWNSIRYAIAAGVALTLYVQFAVNFVHPAPDTSEAPWRRHALLFWSGPATSIQTVMECERARYAVSPAGASAMIPDDNEAPQVRWYLRDFALSDSPVAASIVVTIGKTQSGALAANPDAPDFGFEEWWTPDFGTLTIGGAIRYLLTQRAWSDVEIRDLEIAIPRPDNTPSSATGGKIEDK
jgi:predicted membrane-bound mannosyltransferase